MSEIDELRENIELWAVSIAGPDDLVPVAGYGEACSLANSFNTWWQQHIASRGGLHKFDPRMWASPIIYPWSAESHGEGLRNPSKDYAPFVRNSDDNLVERVAAAIWTAGYGTPSKPAWPEGVVGGSQELFRKMADGAIKALSSRTSKAVVRAFEAAYPDLFWHIAKGRLTPDEPMYGAIILRGEEELGSGESNISADAAFASAIVSTGLPFELLALSADAAGAGEDGWRGIESAPLDGTAVVIAVPTKDRDGFIVGEAHYDAEHDGWWWAGNSWGDYHGGPISEINYRLPTQWQPLPSPPISQGEELAYQCDSCSEPGYGPAATCNCTPPSQPVVEPSLSPVETKEN